MFVAPIKRIEPIAAGTAAAGTAITRLLGRKISNAVGRIVVMNLRILTGATAHTLTIMKSKSRGLALADAAAGQAVIHCIEDLGVKGGVGALAAGDMLVIQLEDADAHLAVVQSVSGSAGDFAITLTANLPKAVKKGAVIICYGAVGDNHETATLQASTLNVFESDVGYFIAERQGEPIILSINNATNASNIQGGVYGEVDA